MAPEFAKMSPKAIAKIWQSGVLIGPMWNLFVNKIVFAIGCLSWLWFKVCDWQLDPRTPR